MKLEFIEEPGVRKERLSDWCKTQNISFYEYNGILYTNRQQLVQPLAPFYKSINLTKREALNIINVLKGGVIRWPARKNKKINTKKDWYIVVKSIGAHYDELSTSTKGLLDKGFNNFTVKKVDALQIAKKGFNILQKHNTQHLNFDDIIPYHSEEQFIDIITKDQKFDDIIHYFGIFLKDDLIGFCRCNVYDKTEVHLTQLIIDNEHLTYGAKHALTWYILGYYFDYCQYKTIVSGSRPYDPTDKNSQFFLEEFMFEKAYFDLNVVFRRDIDYKVSFMKPFKKIMGKINADLQVFIDIDEQKTK